MKDIVESLYQACHSKDLTIHGLSTDLGALRDEVVLAQSQLQSQVSKCIKYETILDHKGSEIQSLMTELGVAKKPLVSSLEVREQLHASLAASSAARVGDRGEKFQCLSIIQFRRSMLKHRGQTMLSLKQLNRSQPK